jgi:SNW domain-containing protein 1
MGKSKSKGSSNALAVQLDEKGEVKFNLIARQGVANKEKIIYSKFTDLLPKQVTEDDPSLARPDAETAREVRKMFFLINFLFIINFMKF